MAQHYASTLLPVELADVNPVYRLHADANVVEQVTRCVKITSSAPRAGADDDAETLDVTPDLAEFLVRTRVEECHCRLGDGGDLRHTVEDADATFRGFRTKFVQLVQEHPDVHTFRVQHVGAAHWYPEFVAACVASCLLHARTVQVHIVDPSPAYAELMRTLGCGMFSKGYALRSRALELKDVGMSPYGIVADCAACREVALACEPFNQDSPLFAAATTATGGTASFGDGSRSRPGRSHSPISKRPRVT